MAETTAEDNIDVAKIDAWWNTMDADAKLAIMKVFSNELPFTLQDIAGERVKGTNKGIVVTEEDHIEFSRRREKYLLDRMEAREALGDLLNNERGQQQPVEFCPITVHSVARERTKGKNETVYAEDYVKLEKKKKEYYASLAESLEQQLKATDMMGQLKALRDAIETGEAMFGEMLQIQQETRKQGLLGIFHRARASARQEEAKEKFQELQIQRFEKLLASTQFIDPNEVVGARKYLQAIIENFTQGYRIKKLAKEAIGGKQLTQLEFKANN